MSVSVQVMGILGRRMEVAVPAARVEKAFSLRLQTVSRTAKIKGFRPGKAPLDIVRRQHGGQVREEVVNELIGQALSESLRQEGLQPVGQPQVEPLSMGSGEDLRFAAHFEVYPTVTLQGHEGMELSLPQVEVGTADIDAMIETLRKQRPDYADAGRAAQDQDRVTVDFEGTLDGVPFDGGKAEGINFILGAGRMIPDFEAGIRGCFCGGTTMLPQYVRFIVEEVLENRVGFYPTYGNTLMGLAASVPLTKEDNFSITYYAPQPRAVLRVVDPNNTEKTVDYDTWGRVELTTMTKEFFMPRFLERDEALRRKPRAPYAWDGVAEVRPFGAMEKTIVEGVY